MISGLTGAIIAFALILLFLMALQQPLHSLAALYHMPILLEGLSFGHVILLLVIGAGLGVLSTQLSVRKHLLMIRPE